MSVKFSVKKAPPRSSGGRKQLAPSLEPSPSEQRLQRLRYMYNAMLAKDSTTTITKKGSSLSNRQSSQKVASPISRGSSSTRSNASSISIKEPVSRVMMARALGNVFSNQNSVSRTTVKSFGSNNSRDTDTEKRVCVGRSYGNRHSQLNVEKVKKQKLKEPNKSQEHQPVKSTDEEQHRRWANKTATHEYGVYYSLKNRLTLLEDQRDQMVRLYGIDAFLDEYTELLEDCWRFETSHSNVAKYATGKIGRVLNDCERSKQKVKTPKRNQKPSTTVDSSKKTKTAVVPVPSNTSSYKSSTTKSILSKNSVATLSNHMSDSDHVFTSQLTLQDLQPKHKLSNSVLQTNVRKIPSKQTTNHHEQRERLSQNVHSETGSVFVQETDMKTNDGEEEEAPKLDFSTDQLIPDQRHRESSSTVFLDTSEEFSSTVFEQTSNVDLHRASILSAIIEKMDCGGVKQSETSETEDIQHIVAADEDILDEEKSIELANEILRQIVTNCVEGMMATTTKRLEIQSI